MNTLLLIAVGIIVLLIVGLFFYVKSRFDFIDFMVMDISETVDNMNDTVKCVHDRLHQFCGDAIEEEENQAGESKPEEESKE